MRYSIDFFSLIVIGLNLLALAIGAGTDPSWLISPPLIIATGFLSFISLYVNHNHMHLGIFTSRWLNLITNACLSLCNGFPVTMLYIPHLVNHHPNSCNDADWTGGYLAGSARGPWRVIRYIGMVQFNLARVGSGQLKGLPVERRTSVMIEAAVLAAGAILLIGVLQIPITRLLLHLVLPWQLATNGLIFMNFFVHDGCNPEDEMSASRSFVSPITNWLLLNNGFHLAHHLRPRLHWSLIPDFHHEHLASKLDSRYTHKSATKHFLNHYVLGAEFD